MISRRKWGVIIILIVLVISIFTWKYTLYRNLRKYDYESIAYFTYITLVNYKNTIGTLPESMSDLSSFYDKSEFNKPFDYAPGLNTNKISFVKSDTSIAVMYKLNNFHFGSSILVIGDTISFKNYLTSDYLVLCHAPLDLEM